MKLDEIESHDHRDTKSLRYFLKIIHPIDDDEKLDDAIPDKRK